MADDFNNPTAYRGRIMVGVMNAVMDAGRVDGSDATMLQLDVALDALCESIALLVAGSVRETPKQRRDTADRCRKHILTAAIAIEHRLAAGEELPVQFEMVGRRN